MSVAERHSTSSRSSRPVASIPMLSGSFAHCHVQRMSSQVSGSPSDQASPSRSRQWTVIASPPTPGIARLPSAADGTAAASAGR